MKERDPQLRSDARRNQQRILRAAARLLADDTAATTQQIADAAEVGRQTVYRRYPTRDLLVQAIVAEAVAEFSAALEHAESHSENGADAIEQVTRALARIAGTYPILLADPGGAHEADAEGATTRDRAVLVARFEAEIARGQRDGSVRSDVAPAVIRHALFGAISMTMRRVEQEADGGRLSADGIGDQVAALIMDGLRASGR